MGYLDARIVIQSVRKTFKQWRSCKKDALLIDAMITWADAEINSITNKGDAEADFEKALKEFNEIGDTLFLALVSERFASFLYRRSKLKYAKTIFKEALDSYRSAGASLKVSLKQELGIHKLIEGDFTSSHTSKIKSFTSKVDRWSGGEIKKRYSKSLNLVIESACSIDIAQYLEHAIRSSLETLAVNSGANKIIYFHRYLSSGQF